MKTKKNAQVGNLPGFRKSAEETAQEEIKEPQAPASTRERFQLSFDLNEDGSPDLTSMRGRTKEKVQAFFSDPKFAAAFGAKPAGPASIDFFPQGPGEKYPAMIGSLYNMVGMIEAMAVQNIWKVPAPVAVRVFTYTEQEKEALAPPTVKVLNKYAPAWLIKYQDEIALANILLTITAMKIQTARALAKMGDTTPPQTPSQPENEETGKKDTPIQ